MQGYGLGQFWVGFQFPEILNACPFLEHKKKSVQYMAIIDHKMFDFRRFVDYLKNFTTDSSRTLGL